MAAENDRERRDWRLPVQEPLPRIKKVSPASLPEKNVASTATSEEKIEEDFVILDEIEDALETLDLVESKVSEEKTPEAKTEQPKGDGDAEVKPKSDGDAEVKPKSYAEVLLADAVRTKTENDANAYSSTLNAALDFFSSVVPDTDTEEVFRLLRAAWTEDPNLILRCIFHLRDVRHGKSDAYKFSDCLYWLYLNHPKTLIANLRHVPRIGYWKDLLNFLVRLVVGEEEHQEEVKRIRECEKSKTTKKLEKENLKREWENVLERAKKMWAEAPGGSSSFQRKSVFVMLEKESRPRIRRIHRRGIRAIKKISTTPSPSTPRLNPLTKKPFSSRAKKRQQWIRRTVENIKKGVPVRDREEVRQQQIARGQVLKQEAAQLRHTKRREQAERACYIFRTDRNYRAVHVEIARLFAVALTKDLAKMEKCASSPEDAKKRENFCTLASKWAPTLDGHHDKVTHIATTITQILFQEETESSELSAVQISYLRERYRKEVITPLRKFTKVVESMLNYGLCKEIAYKTVPAVSMRRNKPRFEELDTERFDRYLKDVAEGKSTIAAAALKPHEMVREVMREKRSRSEIDDEKKLREDEVRELQWASYRDRLTKNGKLDRVMPIVDVSGSMSGEPMEVAIALGLLCAEVTKPPYNKLVCTFSNRPEFFKVDQPTLREKVLAMSGMHWEMNTNFEAVFDLILQRALSTKLPPNEMISLLIVFSDMEFDAARSNPSQDWTSLHDKIERKFQKHGYNLPCIVYWNLRGGKYAGGRTKCTFPVTSDKKGVALVGGFSGQMLKLFMDGDLDFDPVSMMNKALKRYHFLKVVD